MNAKEFTSAWTTYTTDGELSPIVVTEMEAALDGDVALRSEALDDQQLHRMLGSMGDVHNSQDDFVTNVMAACRGVDNPLAPEGSGSSASAKPWIRTAAIAAALAAMVLIASVSIYEARLARQEAAAARLAANKAEALLRQSVTSEPARPSETLRDSAAGDLRLEKRQFPEIASRRTDGFRQVPTASNEQSVGAKPTVDPVLARVFGEAGAVWNSGPMGRELVAGDFQLEEGNVTLRTNGGTLIKLAGPVQFSLLDKTSVSLKKGEMALRVSPRDVGFRVVTLNSEVIDLGTIFRVAVDDKNVTNVFLERGVVEVIPWSLEQSRIQLTSGQFEVATVRGHAEDSKPAAAYASGRNGFRGMVRLANEAMDFKSVKRFNEVFDALSDKYSDAPQATVKAWLETSSLVDRLAGEITLNGQDRSYASLDDILQIERDMVQSGDSSEVASARAPRSFIGAVTIRGRTYSFKSREEYTKVLEEVLSPLRKLGLPDFQQRQQQKDEKTNPFQR